MNGMTMFRSRVYSEPEPKHRLPVPVVIKHVEHSARHRAEVEEIEAWTA